MRVLMPYMRRGSPRSGADRQGLQQAAIASSLGREALTLVPASDAQYADDYRRTAGRGYAAISMPLRFVPEWDSPTNGVPLFQRAKVDRGTHRFERTDGRCLGAEAPAELFTRRKSRSIGCA
jgi:hypothetical protein